MYFKLAARNVKRQIGNYSIYFVTVAMTVALLFAVNNVIFGKNLLQIVADGQDAKGALKAGIVCLSLVVAFVLGFATSFLLKLRKREFGTYLTLGMARADILRIFLMETVLICIVALLLGVFLGLFLYQGLMAILMNLMEMQFTLSPYSPDGLMATVVLVSAIFVLSCGASAVYLKRASIYELIHAEKKVERAARHPLPWLAAMAVSLAVIAVSGFALKQQLDDMILDGASLDEVTPIFMLLAAGTVFFHISMANSIVPLLLKKKKLCSRGTNRFVLRQLSGTLSANSIMIGMLALLLTSAVIVSNFSFAQRAIQREELNKEYPYDVMYTSDRFSALMEPEKAKAHTQRTPIKETKDIIKKYAPITYWLSYATYTNKKDDLYTQTKWSGASYEGLNDSFMKVSDYNKIAVSLGREPLRLKHEFYIILKTPEAKQFSWQNLHIKINGKKYACRGVAADCPTLHYVPFFAVVPDQAVKGMEMDAQFAAYELAGQSYDSVALKHELSRLAKKWMKKTKHWENCSFRLREYGRFEQNSVYAILVVGSLFVALVLLFMAMAILALKTLSAIADDQKRYRILFRLGASPREQSRALFRQTSSLFLLPFAFPICLSLPAACICSHTMALNGYEAMSGEIYLIAGAIALVISAIYALYYTLTYLIAKRAILR